MSDRRAGRTVSWELNRGGDPQLPGENGHCYVDLTAVRTNNDLECALASTAITNGGQSDKKWDRHIPCCRTRCAWFQVWRLACGGSAPLGLLPTTSHASSKCIVCSSTSNPHACRAMFRPAIICPCTHGRVILGTLAQLRTILFSLSSINE